MCCAAPATAPMAAPAAAPFAAAPSTDGSSAESRSSSRIPSAESRSSSGITSPPIAVQSGGCPLDGRRNATIRELQSGYISGVAIATNGTARNYLQRAPSPSGLADVLDVILDKGLVIDAYVRVAVAGVEVLTVDARIVIASVDTYLRFAEAVNRLDLSQTEVAGLKELREGGGAGGENRGDGKSKGMLEGVKEKVSSGKNK